MLQSGLMTMVIDQNPEQQARFALDVLMHHFGNVEIPTSARPVPQGCRSRSSALNFCRPYSGPPAYKLSGVMISKGIVRCRMTPFPAA